MTETPATTEFRALVSRRMMLRGLSALPLLSLANCATRGPVGAPGFAAVAPTMADRISAPEGFDSRVLISWGDPLFEGMAPFDPETLTRAEQERRFGQNNDFLAFFPAAPGFPLDAAGEDFILCANHEFFDLAMLRPSARTHADLSPEDRAAALASMGASVLHIRREGDGWRVLKTPANRRITPFTPAIFTGPAAGHRWIAQAAAFIANTEGAAPPGTIACGTMSNCSGGRTPWGTYLTSEENFNNYTFRDGPDTDQLAAARKDAALARDAASFYLPLSTASTAPHTLARYNLAQNPTAGALYGWVVEIDPYDPDWRPRKHTALGRKKGECAQTALTRDGRLAVYMGDDQVNEHVYKFVTRRAFDPADRAANRDLLSEGQLYAARFEQDGAGAWLPITLAAANEAARQAGYAPAFADEADLMMRAREAARLLGATKMDRPEDVEPITDERWVGNGAVLVVCTGNREESEAHPGNPRREGGDGPQPNLQGHILRLDEENGDCGATRFTWDVFALGGDPAAQAPVIATPNYPALHASVKVAGAPTISGDRLACPDNVCIDSAMNVWVTTDGGDTVWGDGNDALYCIPVNAAGARPVKRFLVGPIGCELTGPALSPDETALFVSVQHPGDADAKGKPFREQRWSGAAATPPSAFPDGGWPRASVVYVTCKDGGKIWS